MASRMITGFWIGHYVQWGREFPISAALEESGGRLTGRMRDGHPEYDTSVFEATLQAGLPPGTDEQIEARIREMVPDSTGQPIRYVSKLPEVSFLDGTVSDRRIAFVKTYQGKSVGGYRVGDRWMVAEAPSQDVHYEGYLSEDGETIEGRWWIAPESTATRRIEGEFLLHRSKSEPAGQEPSAAPTSDTPPWWRFWR